MDFRGFWCKRGGFGGVSEVESWISGAFQEEEEREKLFKLIDINHNGVLSLAEIDKELVMT